MAPPKRMTRLRAKSTNQRDDSSQPVDQELPALQTSQVSQRNRSKNYSKEECDILVYLCTKFALTINKNSNSEADKKLKTAAWAKIKLKFDEQCEAEGLEVSIITSKHMFHVHFAQCKLTHSIDLFLCKG